MPPALVIGSTEGSSSITGGGSQEWVQLWADGPKWAKFNIGSTITTSRFRPSSWVFPVRPATPTLTANTPYLFLPAEGVYSVDYSGSRTIPATISAGSTTVGKWTFKGVYSKQTWNALGNDYGFAAYSGIATDGTTEVKAGDFVRAASGASVKAMRCYLTYNPSAGTREDNTVDELPESITVVLLSSNGTTAIGDINLHNGEVTLDEDIWFDLTGRILNGKPTQKGIYINKGKKVMVK